MDGSKEDLVIMEKKKPREGNVMAFATGKRKRAVAKAVIKKGKGSVKVNSFSLENYPNMFVRMKVKEALVIAGDKTKDLSIKVSARGGGIMGQADAMRQAIAKGLVDVFGEELRKKYLVYDRNLLVYDVRRTEPHKPPRSSQGPRRYKQRSKR